MAKKTLSATLRDLASDDSSRTETARLREVFDDIEIAIKAGVTIPVILKTLREEHQFTMSINGFRSALRRIRQERKKLVPQNSIEQSPAKMVDQAHQETKLSASQGEALYQENPFRKKIEEATRREDPRRHAFTYNPVPDRNLIYGEDDETNDK